MAPVSDVWRHFTKVNKLEATCNLCMKKLKTGGGTSNLKSHLKSQHKEFAELTGNNHREDSVDIDDIDSIGLDVPLDADLTSFGSPSPASASFRTSFRSPSPASALVRSRSPSASRSPSTSSRSLISPPPSVRQQTLVELTERAATYERGGARDVSITNAVVYMICKDNSPHSIVEKEGFKHLMKTTVPLYKLPSRPSVTKMVSLRYSAIISKIRSRLENVEHICLTADLCTLVQTSRGFLVVTAHFVCPETAEIETVMLGVRRLKDAHTSDNIAKHMEEILDLFGIPKSKIVAVCTDGASNIQAAVRILLGEGKNVYCLAHRLNLMVADGLQDERNQRLTELISLVKEIVKFGRQSNSFVEALRAEQERDGKSEGDVSLLIQSVMTRWNSDLYMLRRFVALSSYIARVLADPTLKKAPRMLTGDEIEVIMEVINVLTPFEQASKEISGSEYITGSIVLPMLSCIETSLNTMAPSSDVANILLQKLIASFKERSKKLRSNTLLCRATLLDPRFKKLYMAPGIAAQVVVDVSSEMKQLQPGPVEQTAQSSSSEAAQGVGVGSLWSYHDSSLSRGNASTDDSNVPNELRLYLQQPVIDRQCEPVKQYWFQSRACLQSLPKIAIKYLTVFGSSVPSERLVSSLNDVVSDERCRLTNQHIEERVFLYRVDPKYWVDM